MTRRELVLGVLLTLPTAVAAQDRDAIDLHPVAVEVQQRQSEKSPALAALLSWLAFPGVGSYYAGNSAHGTRHVVVGAVSLGGAIALLATCENDGFCDFDHDAARLTVTIGLGVTYVVNSVWSIITAVNDAEDFNLRLTSGQASFATALTVLPRGSGGALPSRLAIRIARVAF